MDPYTQHGAARTQWAEQQVKASKNYLKKMTGATKNLTQLSFIQDDGGQINWINDLDAVFVTINKLITSLQNDKWVSQRIITDALKIPPSLIKVRKHFNQRVTQADSSITSPERSKGGKPSLQLGGEIPLWTQRLEKDAMT